MICIACRWTWTLFQDITFQAMIIFYRMVSRAKCILPNPLTKPLTLSSWTQHQFIGVGSDKTHVNCLQTQSINVTIQCNCEHHVKTNEKWRVLPWNINWYGDFSAKRSTRRIKPLSLYWIYLTSSNYVITFVWGFG